MARCAKAGIETPTVYFIDTIARRIYVEWIEGVTIKHFLHTNPNLPEEGTVLIQ